MRAQNLLSELPFTTSKYRLEGHINAMLAYGHNPQALRELLMLMTHLMNDLQERSNNNESINMNHYHDMNTIISITLINDTRLQAQIARDYLNNHQELVQLYMPQAVTPATGILAFFSYIIAGFASCALGSSSKYALEKSVVPMSGIDDLILRYDPYNGDDQEGGSGSLT